MSCKTANLHARIEAAKKQKLATRTEKFNQTGTRGGTQSANCSAQQLLDPITHKDHRHACSSHRHAGTTIGRARTHKTSKLRGAPHLCHSSGSLIAEPLLHLLVAVVGEQISRLQASCSHATFELVFLEVFNFVLALLYSRHCPLEPFFTMPSLT